jgi:hypothetical protein
MITMRTEVYEAIRDLGVSEEKARKAAQMLSPREDYTHGFKADIRLIKLMICLVLGLQITILGAGLKFLIG